MWDDDEYPFGDCWQLADFMKKLGLFYPIDQQGQALDETYAFEVSMEG